MYNDNIIFKGCIYKIDSSFNIEYEKEILYRFVNIDDTYFYAQEISTGIILPTCNFSRIEYDKNKNLKFNNFSYLKDGKYFIIINLKSKKDTFGKYEIDIEKQALVSSIVDNETIEKYCKMMKKDFPYTTKLINYEQENHYFTSTSLIKRKILKLYGDISEIMEESQSSNNKHYRSNLMFPDQIKTLGYDLSKQEKLCNAIARTDEIKKIIKNVIIKEKSVILIGESGSGKTSIVEKLALEIKNGTNEWLNDKTIFYLNTSSLISNTKFRGEFEEKLNNLINYCNKNRGKIIIFIDEIHTLYGLGRSSESSIDAINILKPHISNGNIIVIGSTTKEEYSKYIASDPAFARRFEKIYIPNPTEDLNIKILINYIKELEQNYKVKLLIDENKLETLVKYIINITDIKHQKSIDDIKIINPAISKSIIEEAFAEAKYLKRNNVSIEDICIAISECDRLSPTIRKEESQKLKEMILINSEIKPKRRLRASKKVVEFPINN